MNKRKAIAASAIIILALAGIYAAFGGNGPTVEHITVKAPENAKSILAAGTLKSSDSIEYRAQVSGQILKAPFSEGASVSTGDILFTIDPSGQENAAAQKKAAYDSAAARYNDLLDTLLPNAEQSLRKYTIEKDAAQDAYNSARQLYDAGGLSKSELDDYALEYEDSLASYESAARQLATLSAGGSARRQLESDMAAAKADYAKSMADLAKYTVTAQKDGTLIKKYADAGSYAQIGQILAYTGTFDGIYVAANLDERYFSLVSAGMKAYVFIDENEKFDSSVASVSPLIDKETGEFSVRLALDQSFPYKASDLTVNIELVPGVETVFQVPDGYIVTADDGSYIWKYVDGRIAKTEVKVASSASGNSKISAGIEDGDVLVLPQPGFRDGQNVSIK